MSVVTIMPGSTHTEEGFQVCLNAIRTHKAFCDSDLVFLDNNSDRVDLQAKLCQECRALRYRYEYINGDVHINAFYNYGTELTALDKTPSEYLAYCNADVVFYEGWLDNLLDLWNQTDNKNKYLSMHPFSYSTDMQGLCYRNSPDPEDKVVSCEHPLMHVTVLRRSTTFVFDSQFSFWETDCDYWMTLRSMGAYAGIAYNSRVDHLGGKIASNCGTHTPHNEQAKEAAKQLFEAKWRPMISE